MKRSAVGFLSVLLLALMPAPAPAADLELAITLPLTGSNAKFGEIQKRSYEIAVEEINAADDITQKHCR